MQNPAPFVRRDQASPDTITFEILESYGFLATNRMPVESRLRAYSVTCITRWAMSFHNHCEQVCFEALYNKEYVNISDC